MDEELVVLVDAQDRAIGEAPKLEAHLEGWLHRAVSVVLFDPTGAMLLQRRAEGKYHSAGLWSNACCTHPRVGERPHDAAVRRLGEEMGMVCPLAHAFSFVYRAELGGGLIEHELDHVFTGVTNDVPRPDPAEVQQWRWMDPEELGREMAAAPNRFTAWFPLLLERLLPRRVPGGGPSVRTH